MYHHRSSPNLEAQLASLNSGLRHTNAFYASTHIRCSGFQPELCSADASGLDELDNLPSLTKVEIRWKLT